jgi:hypothetical protein
VNNQFFNASYEKILQEIKPQIIDHKVGILSTVIYILEPLEAEEVCKKYSINNKSNLDQDWLSVSNIINTVFIDKQAVVKFFAGFKDLHNLFNETVSTQEEKMEWIVIAGIMLIGVYFSTKNLSKNRQQLQLKQQELKSYNSPTKNASLCLVVAASEVSHIQVNSVVIRSDIEKLIDGASYFLCVETEELQQNYLDYTDQPIPSAGEQEVYMRIDIAKGQAILGKKSPYVLKRDLPPEAQGTIKELAVLGSLKGLETFNRI